jgi:iron(III) transport system ATP-binding protein
VSADLNIEDLRKSFAMGRPAIDGVTLQISAGEIVVLLGPSGCGKTTLLRCVAGLEHPSGGRIDIGGVRVSDPARALLLPPRARQIGMVFQSYAVWPHMTVWQNVEYPLKNRSLSKAQRSSKVEEALATVGLGQYKDRPVTALSGGQMQRVALARSLVYSPRLLLLDEPLSNLDAALRLRLRGELRRIIKSTGVTALYVTHDQSEAIAIGDRIGVMCNGKLLQLAPTSEIFDKPANRFVAGFTGASNVLEGNLVEAGADSGIVQLRSGDRIRVVLPAPVPRGDAVVVALRPENIQLGGPSADDALNRLGALVKQRNYQGTQTLYRLESGNDIFEAVELGSAPRFAVGERLTASIPVHASWAYPASDEAA